MNIHWSSVVIAKHLGQVLTPQIAKNIALEIIAGPDQTVQVTGTTARQHNDYDIETAEYLRYGIKLFQAALAAPGEAGHAEILHATIAAKPGSVYVDMGCGVGEISRLFGAIDPTAQFISVTNSEVQAAMTRHMGGSTVVMADFHDTGIPDASVDVVMFNETWGYGDPKRLANEAFRMLRPGGVIFLKDWYSPSSGYSPEWDWHQWSADAVLEDIEQAGFIGVGFQDMQQVFRDRYQQFMEWSDLMRKFHPRGLRLAATPAYFKGFKP